MVWIKKDGDNYEFSKWDRREGWKNCTTKDKLYKDYVKWEKEKEKEESIKGLKIDLKMRIDAGTVLNLDMSAEQAELDTLMGD